MAILNRCLCFDNVRTGSFASGIYTLVYAMVGFVYFAVIIVITINYEDSSMYYVTSIFGMIFSGLAFITAIFMVIGVHQDLKPMLIPYIIIKALIILLLCVLLIVYIVDLTIFHVLNLLFILMMMAIIAVNIMCFLCVVSQYQELKAGRGMGY
ncbi:uncharacterized protein LOC110984090 isoform X2 [Acanthaster planci]|uniref:Uncharacterized protein LOC110984090 isoform X2 n=1 Tax=Acanthaster planci TaxID=133434 RepID=A0A8B7Z1W9_ACAPL|nr:uncharacterized protein LOC110984090 isoform X2 [Acanthaster planci]